MAQEIFISYRRKDTGGYAGRLYDHLIHEYGEDGVLFDIEVEGTAEQLRSWVQRVVPKASVVLVLIGDQWVEDRFQRRRLEEPDDVVRLEIEIALSNEIPVIPLLVDGANLPRISDLPNSIAELVRYKGYDINNSYWEAKLELLLEAISSVTKLHTPIIKRGVNRWNAWRAENRKVIPNLKNAQLSAKDLDGVDLSGTDLRGADLRGTSLRNGLLQLADFTEANLQRASLENVQAEGAKFMHTDMTEVNFKGAYLNQANFSHANLNGADLTGASLEGCQVFGVSVWNTRLGDAIQRNLYLGDVSTGDGITVDSIQMAVIIHLLLTSGGVRDMIDTVASKSVLILGRFSVGRKANLDSLRDQLRTRNYVPVLFDFDRPRTRGFTETISLLAHMSRFIIADITGPSFPQELYYMVPHIPSVPVVTIFEATSSIPGIYQNLSKYPWVLPPYAYKNIEELVLAIDERVIAPAEAKINEMVDWRSRIDGKLLDG